MIQRIVNNLGVVFVAVGCLVLLATPRGGATNGCLWDTDTLKHEANGLPGALEIIVGRFDRYPDLYYQMRLDRVVGELAENPGDLLLLDDAAVACDRLGRHDEAIAFMAQKRAALDALAGPNDEHEYRYLANLGTFHIHRWLASGADRSDMDDAHRAAELIDQAITLNPDAHFGREFVQLMAIRWILTLNENPHHAFFVLVDAPVAPGFRDPPQSVANIVSRRNGGKEKLIEGVLGLIALGNAWESVDAFASLALLLDTNRDASLSYAAKLRMLRLLRDGGSSLSPSAGGIVTQFNPMGLSTDQESTIGRYLERAVNAAEAHQQAREAYILERLNAGDHPDTDPHFFDQWVDRHPMPTPPGNRLVLILQIVGGALFVVLVVIALRGVIQRVRNAHNPRGRAA